MPPVKSRKSPVASASDSDVPKNCAPSRRSLRPRRPSLFRSSLLNAQSRSCSKISRGWGLPVMVCVSAARKTSPAARLPSSMCAPTAAPLTRARSGNSPITSTSGFSPAPVMAGVNSGTRSSSGSAAAAPVVSRTSLSGLTASATFCRYLSTRYAQAITGFIPSIFSYSGQSISPTDPSLEYFDGGDLMICSMMGSQSSGSSGATPFQPHFSLILLSSLS
mmetsp:Transcript_9308/g.37706  ORF Transcript_9308/g.37706 Transcript_9308/m.37706 type:complete len:220 (+) Transcript_9308:2697-3356(+)